jgi:endonuclease YncB( thermonuclease family)
MSAATPARKAALALSATLAVTPAQAEFIAGIGVAADGDSFRIGDQVIRLFAIDAPELAQSCPTAAGRTWRCGEAAMKRLADILALGAVACEGAERDPYGRLIAECDDWNGNSINATLVAEGMAWAFTRFGDLFVAEERDAKADGLGIWQAPAMPAWEFRAAQGGGRR